MGNESIFPWISAAYDNKDGRLVSILYHALVCQFHTKSTVNRRPGNEEGYGTYRERFERG